MTSIQKQPRQTGGTKLPQSRNNPDERPNDVDPKMTQREGRYRMLNQKCYRQKGAPYDLLNIYIQHFLLLLHLSGKTFMTFIWPFGNIDQSEIMVVLIFTYLPCALWTVDH